jgi:hypothetical protein
MEMARKRLNLNKSEKLTDLVEGAFSTYLDLLREGIDVARETGNMKKEIDFTTELMKLGERY